MGQLQGDLNEGIWTGATLLNQPLSEVIKGDDVTIHIICQSPGYSQWSLYDFLALEYMTELYVLFDKADWPK